MTSPDRGARAADDRAVVRVACASVGVACLLIALKAWALHATGALSVGASLADSAVDLVASATILIAVIYARKPADDDHRFGHGSAEDIAAIAQAALVLVAAALIAVGAVQRLAGGAAIERELAGIAVMAVSAAVTLGLILWQSRVARQTGSPAVAADRLHYLADLVPNLGALAALAAARWFSVQWLDIVVALAAAAILVSGSLRIFARAFDALMDREADPAVERIVREAAAGVVGIEGVHDIRSRRTGRRVFIQLHAEIAGGRTLAEAHELGECLREAVIAGMPGAEVLIHKDPV